MQLFRPDDGRAVRVDDRSREDGRGGPGERPAPAAAAGGNDAERRP
jgi:hypothetical protein